MSPTCVLCKGINCNKSYIFFIMYCTMYLEACRTTTSRRNVLIVVTIIVLLIAYRNFEITKLLIPLKQLIWSKMDKGSSNLFNQCNW